MGFCHNPFISGEFIGLALGFVGGTVILVANWRKQMYVIFDCSTVWSVRT
jgi:hypothetical protein